MAERPAPIRWLAFACFVAASVLAWTIDWRFAVALALLRIDISIMHPEP